MSEQLYSIHAVDEQGGGKTLLHLPLDEAVEIMEQLRPTHKVVEMKREQKCG